MEPTYRSSCRQPPICFNSERTGEQLEHQQDPPLHQHPQQQQSQQHVANYLHHQPYHTTLLSATQQASYAMDPAIFSLGTGHGHSGSNLVVQAANPPPQPSFLPDAGSQIHGTTFSSPASSRQTPHNAPATTAQKQGHATSAIPSKVAQASSSPSVPPSIGAGAVQDNGSPIQMPASRVLKECQMNIYKHQRLPKKKKTLRAPLACLELPAYLEYKKSSPNDDEKENICGVIAHEEVEEGVEFGPFEGTLLDEEQGSPLPTTWELCLRGKVFFYVNGRRREEQNWMSHMAYARNEDEQNVEAFQYYGEIYFRTTKVIEPGSELKVFYSEEYASRIGFKTKLKDLKFSEDLDDFECTICKSHFPSAKPMVRHMRLEHDPDKPHEMLPVISWKMKGKKPLEKEGPGEKASLTEQKDVERSSKVAAVTSISSKVAAVTSISSKVAAVTSINSKVAAVTSISSTSENLTCPTCGKTFPSEGRLRAHSLFHEYSDEHACPVCGERQPNSRMLAKHMVQHKTTLNQCDKCNRSYKSRGGLYRHQREVHGASHVRQYKCQHCPDLFVKKSECMNHEKMHKISGGKKGGKTGQSPRKKAREPPRQVTTEKRRRYRMISRIQIMPSNIVPNRSKVNDANTNDISERNAGESTGRSAKSKDMLGKAADYYTKMRPYPCRYCEKQYVYRHMLYEHEMMVHKGRGTFKCSCCPRVFVNKNRYLEHMNTHDENRMYRCSLCPRNFATENALANHQEEHTGAKPFKCELCGKGFRIRKAVCAHKRRMHKARVLRFFCTTCNKGFVDKNSLSKHERRHKGIRPFVCLVCGKGFGAKYVLNVHMKTIHSDEKPFQCEVCGKKFTLNQHYASHIFKHRVQGEDIPGQSDPDPPVQEQVSLND